MQGLGIGCADEGMNRGGIPVSGLLYRDADGSIGSQRVLCPMSIGQLFLRFMFKEFKHRS